MALLRAVWTIFSQNFGIKPLFHYPFYLQTIFLKKYLFQEVEKITLLIENQVRQNLLIRFLRQTINFPNLLQRFETTNLITIFYDSCR